MNQKIPSYRIIKDSYRSKIEQGEYIAEQKLPSEKDLMEQFKVSRITVSNAMRALEEEGWIYRVQGKGTFVSDRINSVSDVVRTGKPDPDHEPGISKERTGLIGLIITFIDDYFATQLLRGITKVLDERGYRLAIILSGNSIENEKSAIQDLLRLGVDGLLIFPVDKEIYNDDILALRVNKFPFVLIDRYLPGVETNYVCSDSIKAARLATSYLWELGHRNIAICSNIHLPTVTVADRIRGYQEELISRGAVINPALMLTDIIYSPHQELDDDHPLVRYINSRQASAYLVLNSNLAVMITRVMKKLRIRIPEDASIISIDNPLPEEVEDYYFTHIAQSETLIGIHTANILLDILSEPNNGTYHKIILEPKLITGRTTSSVPTAMNR